MLTVTLPSDVTASLPKLPLLADLGDQDFTSPSVNLLALVCEWLDPRQLHSFSLEIPSVKYNISFSRDLPTLLSQLPSVIVALVGEQPASSTITFCEQGLECEIRVRCEKNDSFVSVVESQTTKPQLQVDTLRVSRGELAGDCRRIAQQAADLITSQLPEILTAGVFTAWVRECGVSL